MGNKDCHPRHRKHSAKENSYPPKCLAKPMTMLLPYRDKNTRSKRKPYS